MAEIFRRIDKNITKISLSDVAVLLADNNMDLPEDTEGLGIALEQMGAWIKLFSDTDWDELSGAYQYTVEQAYRLSQ